jgi:hypothetical protein
MLLFGDIPGLNVSGVTFIEFELSKEKLIFGEGASFSAGIADE